MLYVSLYVCFEISMDYFQCLCWKVLIQIKQTEGEVDSCLYIRQIQLAEENVKL